MKVNVTISEVKTYAAKGYNLKSQYLYSTVYLLLSKNDLVFDRRGYRSRLIEETDNQV